MSDRIELTGLRVRGHHGVFEHERRDGQDFLVDLVVWTDFTAAAESDDLDDTVDYGALALLARHTRCRVLERNLPESDRFDLGRRGKGQQMSNELSVALFAIGALDRQVTDEQ